MSVNLICAIAIIIAAVYYAIKRDEKPLYPGTNIEISEYDVKGDKQGSKVYGTVIAICFIIVFLFGSHNC